MQHRQAYVIGIAGGSASGKTYLIRALEKKFCNGEIGILSQDNYYKPLSEQIPDENGEINFDTPEALDETAFIRDLRLILDGQTIERKEYTFNAPGVIPGKMKIQPAPVLLVEGLFILHHSDIKSVLDMIIFLDSRDDIKFRRRMERDVKERKIPREKALYQWEHHVYPGYRKYLLPYKDEADVILTNNFNLESGIRFICDHIQMRLMELK